MVDLDKDLDEILKKVGDFLETVNNTYPSYLSADPEQKREVVNSITSKLVIEGKKVLIKPHLPFELVANRPKYWLVALF